ncbi:hypothetical protein CPB84DRAFT_1288015 [Gymnopilus junonius]|uniref:Uncharacterized protein n=1 Tax=Gymnopilus junonius TaxID=109634 RepID=A0A9P5TMJ2_GYMJU|nr:hypothetical protein CPB84DRAFT_1288015 [Gymnopilus junonius]
MTYIHAPVTLDNNPNIITMTVSEPEATTPSQSAEPDCTIDITKIEASDSVQSHLSTSTSSKRPIRIPSSSSLDATGVTSNSDPTSTQQSFFPILQWITASARYLSSPASPILPTTKRISTHLDRSGTKTVVKYILLFYCFASCMVAVFRMYGSLLGPQRGRDVAEDVPVPSNIDSVYHFRLVLIFSVSPGNIKSISQFLTRQISPAVLEPFVVSSVNGGSNMTICAWLQDTELNLLEGWTRSSAGIISPMPCPDQADGE